MKLLIMFFIASAFLMMLAVFANKAFAGEQCTTCTATTVDAVVGDMVHAGENQPVGQITTRAFNVPDGYRMVLVAQPPTVICTETEQPDIWKMISIAPVRKYSPARVTAAEEAELNEYLEAGQ